MRTLHLVDRSRLERPLRGPARPRVLETILRYPAQGPSGALDLPGAPPLGGPRPLVVFAHGFDTTPAVYSRLLQTWARAGYVVAAPVFPLERSGAPGGADEADLVNEPGDISFVISRLLAASATATGPLSRLIDSDRIAVAGQSDGGEAALASAYARRLRDPRVRAAVILSGAEMSGIGGYAFGAGEPPLLAMQGTADTSNEPRYTYAYFRSAHRPKYLVRLLGAQHLPPYTAAQPWLGIVERVSIAFLDDYLQGSPTARGQLEKQGVVPGASALSAYP
jgi:predicted dienelactone hydrolase